MKNSLILFIILFFGILCSAPQAEAKTANFKKIVRIIFYGVSFIACGFATFVFFMTSCYGFIEYIFAIPACVLTFICLDNCLKAITESDRKTDLQFVH